MLLHARSVSFIARQSGFYSLYFNHHGHNVELDINKTQTLRVNRPHWNITKGQESIPVGCVPTACCPYLPASTAPVGVPGPGGIPGPLVTCISQQALLRGGVPGPRGYFPRYSPPLRGQTDTCKNIVCGGKNIEEPHLAQTRFN